MTYRRLQPAKILETAIRLQDRVEARFPQRGLSHVARELVALARHVIAETEALTPPLWWLRGLIALGILGGAALFISVGSVISFTRFSGEAIGSVQGIEAFINTAVLGGLGLVTLIQLEHRLKRQRAAQGLHELRAIIHVIDMHQMTKDPSTLHPDYTITTVSPPRSFTSAELDRYLDYCSEMLALTGKLAALYAQAVSDDSLAATVNDIEQLGSSLSGKIWQKIVILDAQADSREPADP
jgi:hypothetical protein